MDIVLDREVLFGQSKSWLWGEKGMFLRHVGDFLGRKMFFQQNGIFEAQNYLLIQKGFSMRHNDFFLIF